MLVFGLIMLVSQCFWSTESTQGTAKLIVDHDGGADDAMAIFMALLYEKYFEGPKVVALTTVNGNVNEPQVFNNTQRILDIAKRRDVPIYRGSKSALVRGYKTDGFFGKDGLGDNDTVKFTPIKAKSEHAALALIRLSKEYEGQLTVISLGSLTNIALAIKLDSNFTRRLNHLYVAAGNIYRENETNAEFNALQDVESYHIVTTQGTPATLTLIPFSQIKSSINISNEWRTDVLGAIPTDIMRALNVFERVSLKKQSTWHLLDPAAMAIALIYSAFVKEISYTDNSIYLCGEARGKNTNKFTVIQNASAKMVMSVEEEIYIKFLKNVFSASLLYQ